MLGSVVFHSPADLHVSPVLHGYWHRPLAELLIEAGAAGGYGNDPFHACAAFVGWCCAQQPSVGSFSLLNAPGAPFLAEADFDWWAWHDRVIADLGATTPPTILIDLDDFLVTRQGKILWPEGRQRRPNRHDSAIHLPDEPFPCGWSWPLTKSYLAPDGLPAIRRPLNGSFDWLREQPESVYPPNTTYEKCAATLERLLIALPGALPEDFVEFFRSRELVERGRGVGGFHLDLDTAGEVQGGRGWLVRFLSESQGCGYYSLYISPCKSKHRVVQTYHYSSSEYKAHPRDITTCATSFEGFLYRFWLEDRVRLARGGHGPMPEEGPDYLERFGDSAGV